MMTSPIKIFNDPVHGFIEVRRGLTLSIIDHPYFQRLRHIRQVGLSELVYMGGVHSRFNHVIGAMHLTHQALNVLKAKGHSISDEETLGTLLAILLHDIGHGPFSHALEFHIVPNTSHEAISLLLIDQLNAEFDGQLAIALAIFNGQYPKYFLHQLISSQLDMDRMDYLMRDSFYTGVQEGIVGTDRIIKTLNINENQLVVEEKGIYSVEKFIIARRLMYWQVYLHKTALCAEHLLVKIWQRAKWAKALGYELFYDTDLAYFLDLPANFNLQGTDIQAFLTHFVAFDEHVLMYALKRWQDGPEPILAQLCQRFINRQLLKLRLYRLPISADTIAAVQQKVIASGPSDIQPDNVEYFVFSGQVVNRAYLRDSEEPINILFKTGEIKDLIHASDLDNIKALSEPVVKYYLCVPDSSFFPSEQQ
jgi:uncharacterized protein